MSRKVIVDFEIVDHGIEGEQYFQGCGLSHSRFEDVATGCGDNPAEAIDDALESLAQNDWDVEGMEKRILAQELPGKRVLPTKPRVTSRHADDCHYYLSIRVMRPIERAPVEWVDSVEPKHGDPVYRQP